LDERGVGCGAEGACHGGGLGWCSRIEQSGGLLKCRARNSRELGRGYIGCG
jgi:hypothetical protein